jgi:single-stranded-DNA-specific exonuclease
MRYELIGKNDYLVDPIKTILNNRGIEDISKFLKLDESVTYDWRLLDNMEKAVDCLLKHIDKESKIFFQVDADPDGYTSSAILINYLNKVFKDKISIEWRLHEGKEHGIILDTVPPDAHLVIAPDGTSNQYEEYKALKEKGIDVILLDHHECEKESEDAIVVNNQLSPDYQNKSFSGAGIVYKFIKALDERLQIDHADYYLDLVAIGNIADSMDSRSLETRYYAIKGLQQLNNPLIKELFKAQNYSTQGEINFITTSFYINPLINAAVRCGTMEEKLQMMRALLESKEQIYYPRKKINEPIEVNTARLLKNIKARQGRLRDKGVEEIEKQIKEKELLSNKILIINVTGLLEKNLGGLVANKLADQYKRPTLLLRDEEDGVLTGSARGYDRGGVKNLKDFLNNTGKFIYCEGHQSAHGVSIEVNKLVEVNELINKQLEDVKIDMDVYEVDFIVSGKHLTESMIKEIVNLSGLWGHRVEEPLLAFKEIKVNTDDLVLLGDNKSTFKFVHRGIEFIKFKYSEDQFTEMFNKEDGTYIIDVVGRCSVNAWKGNKKSQIIIEEFEVTAVKKKEFIF